MGLDQYWLKTKEEVDMEALNYRYYDEGFTEKDEDLQHIESCKLKEFYYHRKVPALEDFMANEFDKQLLDVTFNDRHLRVTRELLNELQKCVKEKSLNEEASGFFWGHHCAADYEDIQDAIDAANKLLDEGYDIYYLSSW